MKLTIIISLIDPLFVEILVLEPILEVAVAVWGIQLLKLGLSLGFYNILIFRVVFLLCLLFKYELFSLEYLFVYLLARKSMGVTLL
jgi:hypothetical protein